MAEPADNSAWRFRSHVARIALLLALGAFSSLGLAWSIATLQVRLELRERVWIEHRSVLRFPGPQPPVRSSLASEAWTSNIDERFRRLCPGLNQAAEVRIVESRSEGPGHELSAIGCWSLADLDNPWPERFEGEILTLDAGWPFRSWSAELELAGNPTTSAPFTIRTTTDAAALGSRTETGPAAAIWPTPLRAPLPIRPRWSTLPFEILVHASAWAVLLASALWVRAALRLRRQRCPHCGYHLAGLPSCPECGRSPDAP